MTHITARNGRGPRHITTIDMRPVPREYPEDHPFLIGLVGTLMVGAFLFLALVAGIVGLG